MCTNKDDGYVECSQVKVDSYDELKEFIEDNLRIGELGSSPRAGESVTFVIKEKNTVKKRTSSILCPTIDAIINVLAQRTLYTEILIQPHIEMRGKGKTITRAFFTPPNIQVYHISAPVKEIPSSDSDENDSPKESAKPKGEIITRARDCALPQIEEQCRHLCEILDKHYFFPIHMRITGIALDFVQLRTNLWYNSLYLTIVSSKELRATNA